jgi:predicted nucleic acid-binding protein
MTGAPEGDLVFDAEPLVAYFAGEPGAETTRDALDHVVTSVDEGYLNEVNAAEVWYVAKRFTDEATADDHLDWLRYEAELIFVSSEETWEQAASIKAEHRVSLGDAFALGTALARGCPVLAGGDGDFDVGESLGMDVRRVPADG